MKIYIAGPMRGVFGFNALGFQFWQRRVERIMRWEVVNPADLDRSSGFTPNADGELHEGDPSYEDLMARDLEELRKCDAILMLPGWPGSVGAMREYLYACRYQITVYHPRDIILRYST